MPRRTTEDVDGGGIKFRDGGEDAGKDEGGFGVASAGVEGWKKAPPQQEDREDISPGGVEEALDDHGR